jgi:hypothetical protein
MASNAGLSNYQYFGTSIASRYRTRRGIMMRYGCGNIISIRHRTSSDILFIKDGEPEIIFSNVRNAHDVVGCLSQYSKGYSTTKNSDTKEASK